MLLCHEAILSHALSVNTLPTKYPPPSAAKYLETSRGKAKRPGATALLGVPSVIRTRLIDLTPPRLLPKQRQGPAPQRITRDAQRLVIANARSDAVRFSPWDALSAAVGLPGDFAMALLVLARGRYRVRARRMRGDSDAQARLHSSPGNSRRGGFGLTDRRDFS